MLSGSGPVICSVHRGRWQWTGPAKCWGWFGHCESRDQQTGAHFSVCLIPEQLLFVIDGGLTFYWKI